jgi:hypothetical protein
MRTVAIVGMGALFAACVMRRHALGEAIATVPTSALLALAGLHLVSLVARSEAWRLSLAAIGDSRPSRAAIHAANAGAFLAGSLQGHAAIPARVALLRRIAPHEAPHPAHVAVADLPIFLLGVAGASVLLALTGAWWAPPAAVAALVGARLVAGRRYTRARGLGRRTAARRARGTRRLRRRVRCVARVGRACGHASRRLAVRGGGRNSPRWASSGCCRSARRSRRARCWWSAAVPPRSPLAWRSARRRSPQSRSTPRRLHYAAIGPRFGSRP